MELFTQEVPEIFEELLRLKLLPEIQAIDLKLQSRHMMVV